MNFQDLCNKLNFAPECTETLCEAREKILKSSKAFKIATASSYLMMGNEELCGADVRAIAESSGVHRATVVTVMLLESIPLLQKVYADKKYPQELMWETLVDIKCKLEESHDLNGVWGTAAIGWYVRVYRAGIIKLGRLEFEPTGYKWDTPYRGIRKGDMVMNMHIPSTGPMKIEDVLDAFKQAYRFYGYKEPMPVMAASWLLYPPVCEEVFKPGSNLKNFYDLFDVVEQYEDPDNHNFWRIFNMNWQEGILDKVLQNTSLQKNLYNFMAPGRNMGVGRCMLLFDGEKVISK